MKTPALILGAFLAVILAVQVNSEKIRYEGYTVYRFVPETNEQVNILAELESSGVIFWEGPSPIGKPSDVMFAPHQQNLIQDLKDAGFVGSEYISNVQSLIDQERVNPSTKKDGRLSWTQYNTLEQINDFLIAEAAAHPDIATLVSIGKSFEGREVYLMKISTSNDTKPIFFIEANIHSREWITSAVATYVINELLNGKNTTLQSYLNDFDVYVVPNINPDGFAYSHTNERLWRKTRSNTSSPIGCKGADGNRNFDFHWLTGGSSTNPCAETFAGAKAFSEPELKALADYLVTIKDRLTFYLGVHSYGHWILIPYGHTSVHIPEHDEYMRIGGIAREAIRQRFGTIFTPGNVVDLLYVASGEGFDWVKGVLNPYLSIEFELRDKGNYGFLLPPAQIIPSCEETVDGINAVLEQVKIATTKKAHVQTHLAPAPKVDQDPLIKRMKAQVQLDTEKHATFGRAPSRKAQSPLNSFRH